MPFPREEDLLRLNAEKILERAYTETVDNAGSIAIKLAFSITVDKEWFEGEARSVFAEVVVDAIKGAGWVVDFVSLGEHHFLLLWGNEGFTYHGRTTGKLEIKDKKDLPFPKAKADEIQVEDAPPTNSKI